MKPLITSARGLAELATGLSPDAVSTSAVLYESTTPDASFLVAAGDDERSQRVVVFRDDNVKERYVPEHLVDVRRDVLSRMASFAERATTRPLSLPRGWHQYKYHNYVAFFALPNYDRHASRWICEILAGDRADVVFWKTTTSAQREDLDEFVASNTRTVPELDVSWTAAVNAAASHFHGDDHGQQDVDIYLPALEVSPTRGWTYDQWLGAANAGQRAFIEAPTGKSIRLRGPAGSGKTLALTLKAIREVLRARELGEEIRVLAVTHSWALALQISDSMESMGLGVMDEIDVFPLLTVAETLTPHPATGVGVIGEDSFSGKQAQLDEIRELLRDFVGGDWITYKARVSPAFRVRVESEDEAERDALAWDLLVEFGSVLGASAIFPGAGSESRYFQLPRAAWMLPLETREDLRVVFHLYSSYMASLESRSLMTSDQVLADCLSHLETHAWNRTRKSLGYDLIFVDEFHLFSPLERQVLHYLTRDTSTYPRIFMAVDPRQSPSEAFIGLAADETRSSSAATDTDLGDITNLDLITVHRFTPQILALIKHVHLEFPTLDLGRDWDIDFSAVESAEADGPLPRLVISGSRSAEETDIYRAVHELYPRGRIALAIVDSRQWPRFSALASLLGKSNKFHVSTASGRSDVEGLGYRSRGVVVGHAEYLAGLQFDTVLVAGIPDIQHAISTGNERTRLLSHLYLGISRAQREVRVFANDDDGGPTEVLVRAVAKGVLLREAGSAV